MPILAWIAQLLWWVGAIVVDLCESGIFLYEVIWKARADPRPVYRLMRIGGHAMLAAALSVSAASWGWNLGATLWAGFIVASTLIAALALMPLSRLSLCVIPPGMVLGFAAILSALS